MITPLFWAVLAGAALLGGAVAVHLLTGVQLVRTREKLLEQVKSTIEASHRPIR